MDVSLQQQVLTFSETQKNIFQKAKCGKLRVSCYEFLPTIPSYELI